MKRCLLVTIDYEPNHGGVAAYWSRVSADMPEGQWRVLTSVTDGVEPSKNVVRMPLLSRWFWPRWFLGAYRSYKAYKHEQCEMIVAAQLLPVGSMAYLLHRLFDIPYIVQLYGMDLAAAEQHSRRKKLAVRVLQNAQACVANSQATANRAAAFGVAIDKITVVYPVPQAPVAKPVLVADLRALHGLVDKRVLLTVGRLVARKGQDMVIKAMPSVLARVPETVYIVVGDGPDRERLNTLATESGVPVIFTGAVSGEARDAWFALCDAFVMPCRDMAGDTEGFGMVYLEAAAASKPVIASAAGGVSEAVEAGKTGLLVDPQSSEAIAEAIIKLLSDESLRERLGHTGRERFDHYWSWSKQLEQFKRLLV